MLAGLEEYGDGGWREKRRKVELSLSGYEYTRNGGGGRQRLHSFLIEDLHSAQRSPGISCNCPVYGRGHG